MGGKQSFPVVEIPSDRTAIVTGGNTGIGYEIAKWLAIMGASVTIACRSEERARAAIEKMKSELPAAKEKLAKDGVVLTIENLSLDFIKLDLMSFKSVLEFVEAFKSTGKKLHMLVCNAGIGMAPYSKTEDGFESILQTNYLGHFLMIGKLLQLMRSSGDDCRIHLVSSLAHKYSTFDSATINYQGDPNSFKRMEYYGRSKMYQIMQTFSMSRRLKGSNVSVSCCHPGAVDSEFDRVLQDVWYYKFYYNAGRATRTLKTPLDGAKTTLMAVVSPDLKDVSGVYYADCKPASPAASCRDEAKQEQLWKQTLEYLQQHLTEEEVQMLEGKS